MHRSVYFVVACLNKLSIVVWIRVAVSDTNIASDTKHAYPAVIGERISIGADKRKKT